MIEHRSARPASATELTALVELVRNEQPQTLVQIGGGDAAALAAEADLDATACVQTVPDDTGGERDRQDLIRVLAGRPIDLLVLTGEDYYCVRAAFADYAPLVRDCGVIVCSGIDPPDHRSEIRHLWDQLARAYDTREVPDGRLGVLRWDAHRAVPDFDPSPDRSGFGLATHFPVPPGEPVVDVRTAVGPLLLPSGDRWITPALRDNGIWEPAETRWLLAKLRPGQTFVDVGAHVGYFSTLAAKLVGPSGSVIAVEPESRNRDLLHRNLARNGVDNARVVPFAAGARRTFMSLALDERNRGGHRLVPLDDAPTVVRCVRLDDVLPATVDIVKIDAQGYDHEIIDGLEQTLAANPDVSILAELSWYEVVRRRGIDPISVLARLETLGFAFALLDEHGRAQPTSPEAVLEIWRRVGRRSIELSVVLSRPGMTERPPVRPARVDGLEVNELDDGVSIRDVTGATHRLNDTAAAVFDLCTGGNAVEQIVEQVRVTYGLADPPSTDVAQCLAQLRLIGLIV